MKSLFVHLLLSLVLSGMVSCSNDEDEPLAECPNPSHLNGLLQQIQAIQLEIGQLQAQLGTVAGTDQDAINQKREAIRKRGIAIDEELSTYESCF